MSNQHDGSLTDQHDDSPCSEIARFQYKPEESASEVRNALLVVATLIAAVTFQAGVNPPGGVWQEKYPPPSSPSEAPLPSTKEEPHDAGKAVLGYNEASFVFFLLSNTAAFSTSGIIIGVLVKRFPFSYLVRLALLLMVCTYVASVSAVLPNDLVNMVYMAFLLPFIYLLIRHLWHGIKKRRAICWSCICCCCNKK